MSQGYGHNSWIGYGQESTIGTGVAAALFNEMIDESLGLKQKRLFKNRLGTTSRRASVRGKRSVGGSAKMQMLFSGQEVLLKHLLGSVSSAQISATTVYRHTFALANALPVGLSVFVNRDSDSIGGTSCFKYVGSQISKLTLSQGLENFLEGSFEFEGIDEELVSKPTPTFPTFNGIDWEMLGTFTIGGVAVPAEMVELVIDNPLNTDRYKLGSNLRRGLGRSDVRSVSGKLELEFESLAFYNYYRSLADAGALSLIWTGAVAANATPYRLEISAPSLYLQGDTPQVKDGGVIKLPVSFDLVSGANNTELSLILDNLATSVA